MSAVENELSEACMKTLTVSACSPPPYALNLHSDANLFTLRFNGHARANKRRPC